MEAPVPRIVPALVVLGAVFAPAPAAAQLAIEWDVPATECPTVDAVRGEVTRLLGGAVPADLALEARAVATRAGGRWTLRLRTVMDGTEGERVIEGDACAPLADAAALVLALMIDPEAVAANAVVEAPPEEPAPPPDPAPPPAPDPPAHVATQALADPGPPEGRRPRAEGGAISRVVEHEPTTGATERGGDANAGAPSEPLAGLLGLGGAFDVGSVPEPSGAIHVEGGFGVPLIEARVRATFVVGRDAARTTSAGARITTGMLDVRGCVHPFEEARLVYGCLGLALGVSVAEGYGLSSPEVGVGTFGAAVAGLGLAWSPEPWFDLDLDATLIVPFNPLEFAVRASPDDVFHTQEPVAGRFGLSFHVRF